MLFSSSSLIGSPDEFRSTLKRRVRLYHSSIPAVCGREDRQARVSKVGKDRGKEEARTHSGKIKDVRKSLAGGKDGRASCVSVRTETEISVLSRPWGRLASDLLLERASKHEGSGQKIRQESSELWSGERVR